ncbi:hypothetical protein EN858_17530 [Mesorhizobium sp. M4B.F.Ca.ET.215.01.1.1]|uniref:hypothetical protein n=1 Tax=unclassified Mesorhizobium TaxID=325217 RepID=UPI000FCADCC7|nr:MULTISPECIES: hypothetical protein [unclassified Mesorhizobium]RUW68615.1 hypothetical protein EOA31_25450 [Mesorhizobium sp. M4B.F.Ca.ET.049.02.1.2]TGQ10212.1 hypothetical protein EN858_17530 [Mesorhizobium sp. M4B.F.Ca.ET.215.01.1.1]TGQ34049.1 hypothetical protein EN863_033700 [Mesorhizobium sp. M00.F.Ca.ET.220.01.1.1]TGR02751.1 hypothetical protein EN846_16980 [Mesorhizobium sp. M4B.F.Ca.ET.203.01.1.1]TGV26007.1 hypothetical protein EN786_10685 [Mesorhizobium sp. M4B.F.Ca.ET.143.01.1.1]
MQLPSKVTVLAVCLVVWTPSIGVCADMLQSTLPAPDAFAQQLVGAYGAAIGAHVGCHDRTSWAQINVRGGNLVAINECGQGANLTLDGNQTIHYGPTITGRYNDYLGVIYFSNGVQWVKAGGLVAKALGDYPYVADGLCHDHYWHASVEVVQGRFLARNECHQITQLQITDNGNFIATGWRKALGVPDYNGTVSWNTGTDWYKTSP